MKIVFILLGLMLYNITYSQTNYHYIDAEIEKGNFSRAEHLIDSLIMADKSLTPAQVYDLQFQKEVMSRIRKDFTKRLDDILPYIKEYYPNVTDEQIAGWEEDKSLEYKIIDGEKLYFNRAHYNLFRIDAGAKQRKVEIEGEKPESKAAVLAAHLPKVVKLAAEEGNSPVNPVKMKVKYTITVPPNTVPDGEIIRCWMPYPREDSPRQKDIKLLSVNSDEYIIAGNNNLQRTIYAEKKAVKDKPTIFNMSFSYTSYAQRFNIDKTTLKGYNMPLSFTNKYATEDHPHIVFNDVIKELSNKIVRKESNPYNIVKLIYDWVDKIPWASAREYSTIPNIPMYCLTNKHGDCGIQTLLFMTLVRYNGIPAKWQSGWMMHPGEVNLHDWCEVYFEGYGWVPIDQSFGKQNSENPAIRDFYIGGIDSYRLIVNDAYSQPLFPAKIYPRSETVDFQRGELEWRGGNLYFDQWDYHMDVEYLND